MPKLTVRPMGLTLLNVLGNAGALTSVIVEPSAV